MKTWIDREVVSIKEQRTPCEEGILLKVFVILDCGHEKEMNSMFTYRPGDRAKCFEC